MLGPTANWLIALGVGAVMILFDSYFQFDEPIFDDKTDYYSKYKPRFFTSRRRYFRAKCGYILAALCFYLTLSLAPEVYIALFQSTPQSQKSGEGLLVFPVVVALAIIGASNVEPTKSVEKRIRTFFLSMAQIPEGVRRLVAQIRGAEFALHPNRIAVQTENLGLPAATFEKQTHVLFKVFENDQLVNSWHRIGCILTSLVDGKRQGLGIDPLFFETYKVELGEIVSEHKKVGTHVKALLIRISGKPSIWRPGAGNEEDADLLTQTQRLRDRLDIFIACALQSSVRTDIESAIILNKLGITTSHSPKLKGTVMVVAGPIAGFAFVSITIISVFTAYITEEFDKRLLAPLGTENRDIFLVPSGLRRFLWSWTTALYYMAAIMGTLIAREIRVSTRRWFDINSETVERPILAYTMPIVLGTIAGCVTLVLISLVDKYGFAFYKADLSEVWTTISHVCLWFPLAIAISAIALWLVDLPPGKLGHADVVRRSIFGGLCMALIGLVTATMAGNAQLEAFIAKGNSVSHDVRRSVVYTSGLISLLIGIFSTVLCGILQVIGGLVNSRRRLSSATAVFAAAQGPKFVVVLEKTGSAVALRPNETGEESGFAQGRWLQFPEGTVVHWTNHRSFERLDVGENGIISFSGDHLVYEGFNGEIQGEPQFVAHLVSLSKASESTNVGAG